MIYVSFNDSVSGVYQSQVVDTLTALNSRRDQPITLIAFFSLRNYAEQKQKINAAYPHAICVPLVPKLKLWKLNAVTLKLLLLFLPKVNLICRGAFATGIALRAKLSNQKVCYDGRGAVYSECEEYDVLDGTLSLEEVKTIEKEAVLHSDYRIAVTQKLVEYWQELYHYHSPQHVVIPCTLGLDFDSSQDGISRKTLGWNASQIIIVFSGSISGWQSFEHINAILRNYLDTNEKVAVLFMSKDHPVIEQLAQDYPNRIQNKWVAHHEVFSYLSLCDYGMMVREQTVTNQVASPVKCAEYLSAGLKVLISENLGDYSQQIVDHDLGAIISDNAPLPLLPVSEKEKTKAQQYAQEHLTKTAPQITTAYGQLVDALH